MEYWAYVRCVGERLDGGYDITEGRYFLGEKPDPTSWVYFQEQNKMYQDTQAVFQKDFGYFPHGTGLGILPFVEGGDNLEVSWP